MKNPMKFVVLNLVISLLINLQLVKAQQWEWSKTLGNSGQCRAHGITSDSEGNTIITGSFSGTLSLGDTKFKSYGSYDIFLAKYSTNGNLIWAKHAGGTEDEEAFGVACDKEGNVFITGYFSGVLNLDNNALGNGVGENDKNCMVVKYDKDGSLQWAMRSMGAGDKYGKAITTDKDGNVLFTGVFTKEMIIDFELCAMNKDHEEVEIHADLKSESASNIFTAKVASNSNFLWIQQSKGTGINESTSIETDQDGSCYVTGSFSGKCNFGDKKIKSKGGKDIFVSKYDPAGNIIWAKRSGGSLDDQSSGIVKDSNGYMYLTGYFSGSSYFGNTKLQSKDNSNILVTKMDSHGNTLWAKQAGGTGNEYSRGIKLDSKGNIYITGEYNTGFNFMDSKISNSGDWDIFVLNFNNQGEMIKGYQAGGKGRDRGVGITVNEKSNCFVLGTISQEAKFDDINIKTTGDFDIFIAKIKE